MIPLFIRRWRRFTQMIQNNLLVLICAHLRHLRINQFAWVAETKIIALNGMPNRDGYPVGEKQKCDISLILLRKICEYLRRAERCELCSRSIERVADRKFGGAKRRRQGRR